MVRRSFLIVLICALAAGLGNEARSALLACDHVAMHDDAAMTDCGDDGMAMSACVVHCTCIASSVPVLQAIAPALAPSMRQAVRLPDRGSPPDPAPPKR